MEDLPPPPPPMPSESIDQPKKKYIAKKKKEEEDLEKLKLNDLNGSSKFDNSLSADIYKLDWSTISDYIYAGGSDGVFITKLNTGKVILKGSSNPACELFACKFARSLNIPVADTKVIEYTNNEWYVLKNKMMMFAKNRNDNDLRSMEKKFNRATLLVMEFVSGTDLLHLNPQKANLLFQEQQGKENLKGIGKLIVLDILLNNWDRLPIIWDNEGNFANVMFQDSGSAVGIDNGICCIKEFISGNRNKNFDNYFKNTRNFLQCICDSPTREIPQMKNSRESLKMFGGADITEEGSIWIQYGILLTALQLNSLTKEDILKVKKSVEQSVKVDWENVWKNDCAKIEEDFVFHVVQVFQDMNKQIETSINLFKKTFDV